MTHCRFCQQALGTREEYLSVYCKSCKSTQNGSYIDFNIGPYYIFINLKQEYTSYYKRSKLFYRSEVIDNVTPFNALKLIELIEFYS